MAHYPQLPTREPKIHLNNFCRSTPLPGTVTLPPCDLLIQNCNTPASLTFSTSCQLQPFRSISSSTAISSTSGEYHSHKRKFVCILQYTPTFHSASESFDGRQHTIVDLNKSAYSLLVLRLLGRAQTSSCTEHRTTRRSRYSNYFCAQHQT